MSHRKAAGGALPFADPIVAGSEHPRSGPALDPTSWCNRPNAEPNDANTLKRDHWLTIPRQSRGPSGCEPLKAAEWGR